jgi:Concanavalin A-like lectin/glucanases superfamily
MSYQLKVIKDYPIGFWPLDETSGTTATDSSGCGNNGTYTGTLTTNLLPLIPGGTHASKITNSSYVTLSVAKDYYGSTASGGLGDSDTSDNDFTLEVWIYPRFTTSNLTPILGDLTNGMGLFWEKGNIVFKLDSEQINYTVPYTKKSLHIVGTYSVSKMSLYVDGKVVSTKELSGFKFTNSNFVPKIGPTLNASDSFLVDAPAVYRYDLGLAKIKNHYNEIQPLPTIQIAYPENGEIFDFYDNSISKQWSFMYPANKSWTYFASDDLYYNKLDDALEIAKSTGSKTIVIEDIVTVPISYTLDSSKIEWDGENGVSVETSLDGTTYTACTNGGVIPGYSIDSFATDRIIYLKITLSTTDSSKFLPKLSSLILSFYNDQKHYALNSGSYFSTMEGESGVTVYDVTMSNSSYPVLSRHARNGLKTVTDSGFFIQTETLVGTLEFFYTPDSLLTSGLIHTLADGGAASNISWNSLGAMSKTNISAIYINGINKTSETNVSNIFTAGELHHVVIVFSSVVSGPIRFNYGIAGSVPALFQNIAIYPTAFTSQNVTDHLNLYIEKPSVSADDSSFSVTEDAVSIYDNDWLVVKNI